MSIDCDLKRLCRHHHTTPRSPPKPQSHLLLLFFFFLFLLLVLSVSSSPFAVSQSESEAKPLLDYHTNCRDDRDIDRHHTSQYMQTTKWQLPVTYHHHPNCWLLKKEDNSDSFYWLESFSITSFFFFFVFGGFNGFTELCSSRSDDELRLCVGCDRLLRFAAADPSEWMECRSEFLALIEHVSRRSAQFLEDTLT